MKNDFRIKQITKNTWVFEEKLCLFIWFTVAMGSKEEMQYFLEVANKAGL